MSETTENIQSQITGKFNEFITNNPNGGKIAMVIGAIVLLVVGVSIIQWAIRSYRAWKQSKVWLLKGTKSAKKGKILFQNPSNPDSTPIYRSDNEVGGLEFTYSMWIFVDDWSYKYGQWKHIMHKGNSTSWPNRAPGVWLHPTENKLRVYTNTFKNVSEFVDVENIPLNKWFHLAVAVRQQDMDIYINGNLLKRKRLEGLVKQNSGDIYLNSFRGFSGFLSNMQYFNYYINFSELDNILETGPSTSTPTDATDTIPPYNAMNYWSNSK